MNILSISNSPLVITQGSGFVILKTAECLNNRGDFVKLISPEEIDYFKFLKSRMRIYRRIIGMAFYILGNKLNKYNLIIVYGAESFLAVFIMKYIIKIKCPIILHSNGLELKVGYNLNLHTELNQKAKKWYHFNLSKYYLWCYKNVDKIITVSKAEYNFAINQLLLPSNQVTYNNLPVDPIFHFDDKIKKEKIITYCGRWTKNKGCIAMEKAIPKILDLHPEYRFRIIGAGKSMDKIESFGERFQNQVEVIPFVNNKEDMNVLYNQSQIFLFPSLTESFGLVMPESMICGNTLVCSKTGYSEELKDFEEAIVLEKPNAESIILALKLVLDNSKLRMEIAKNGMEKAQELTLENYSKNLFDIINSVVSVKN